MLERPVSRPRLAKDRAAHLDSLLRHRGIEVDVSDIFPLHITPADLIPQLAVRAIRDDQEVALLCRAICKSDGDAILRGRIVDDLLIERYGPRAHAIVKELLEIRPRYRARTRLDLQACDGTGTVSSQVQAEASEAGSQKGTHPRVERLERELGKGLASVVLPV